VVVGDTVVFSGGSQVTALGLADGKVRWQASMDDKLLWTGLVSAGATLVAGTSDGRVVGLDAHSGAVRFVTPIPRGDITVWAVAVVGDTVLAYDDDSDVTGISAGTGAVRWTLKADAHFPGAMAALGSDAAIWLGSGDLAVIDPASGKEVRPRIHDGAKAMLDLPGQPPLLVVAAPGSLRALDPGGRQVWSTPLPVAAQFLAASGDALVASDFDGKIAGYRLSG